MDKVKIANIVKKLTELPQEDRKELTNILLKGLENGVPASEFNEVKEDVNVLKGKNYVLYDEQELTEVQQMQARKNQGLYYEQIAESEVDIELSQFRYDAEYYTWKNIRFYIQGTRDEAHNFVPYIAPKSISDVHSFGWRTSYSQSTPITDINVVVGESAILLSEGLYLLYGPEANITDGPSNPGKNYQYCIVALEGNTENLTPGFYYPSYNEQSGIPDIVSVNYLAEGTVLVPIPEKYLSEAKGVKYVSQELTEGEQMQARKNQDLYYTESSTEEKTAVTTVDECLTKIGTDDCVVVQSGLFSVYWFRFSNDAPQVDDITDIRSYEHWEGKPTGFVTHDGYVSLGTTLYIVFEDNTIIDTLTFGKGVWTYSEVGLGMDMLSYDGIKYNETTETVNKVPEKYLPNTWTSPVKMYVPTIDKTYIGLAFIGLTDIVPSRAVQFSIEGETISSVTINGFQTEDYADNNNEYTFNQEGIYYITVYTTDDNEYGALVYVSYPITT